jgi:uncharacterized protein (DUF2336 family)
MLRDLSKMQSDMSSDMRRQLLNAVTDLFLLDSDPSEGSKAHYGEIATQSLNHLEATDRKVYADQVASAPTLPHTVAMQLAADPEADVARLVLKLSPVLTDNDLAAIAVSQSQKHLVAIAERARLSSSVTDILVARGDRDVLETVSSNDGATFSDSGFDKLLERGGGDSAITGALSRRTDLTPQRATRVLHIVEEMGEHSATTPQASDQIKGLARQARQQRLEVKLLIADLNAKVRELDDVVIMLAHEDRAYHLAQVIAHVAGLHADQTLRVLMQHDVSGIAVACRSVHVGTTAFHAVLALRQRRLNFADHNLENDLRDYGKLDAATADRTMRFLKMKTKIA